MRIPELLVALLFSALLAACGGYEMKNLAKTEVDLVADEFIEESRREVRELLVKLYKRNPDQLAIIPGMAVEGRIAQLKTARGVLDFPELDGLQGIDAMNLTFDPDFRGDRVFALVVGLGGMLRQAYSFKPELFIHDRLNGTALMTSARNVEVLVWKLKNTPQAQWRPLPDHLRVPGGNRQPQLRAPVWQAHRSAGDDGPYCRGSRRQGRDPVGAHGLVGIPAPAHVAGRHWPA